MSGNTGQIRARRATPKGPLHGYLVLDLSRGLAGRFCGRLYGDAGAKVIAPFAVGSGPRDRYVGFSKEYLPPSSDADMRAAVLAAIAVADVVIDDFEAGTLRHEFFTDATSLNDRIVHLTVSPFGRTGPYSSYRANPRLAEALSGLTSERGDPSRPPLHMRSAVPDYAVGLSAFAAGLVALLRAERTSHGERVDVTALETFVLMNESIGVLYPWVGAVPTRAWDRTNYLVGPMPCRDGWIMAYIRGAAEWERFTLILLDRPQLLTDPRFATLELRMRNADALRNEVAGWFRERAATEILEMAQELRMPFGRFVTPEALANDAQVQARGGMVSVQGVHLPGPPARMSRTPLNAKGTALASAVSVKRRTRSRRRIRDQASGLPLEGLRVIDLSIYWAGPACTRIFADFGADVIRIESTRRPDPMRMVILADNNADDRPWERGWAALVNRNKRSLTLDLDSARGRELLLHLVRDADVLVENFSPRVLRNWDLTYDALREVNPQLVMVSLSGFGQNGPYRDFVGFGTTIEAESGIAASTCYGDSDRPYIVDSTVSDPLSGHLAAGIVIAALLERDRSKKGQYIDLSEREAMSYLVGDQLLVDKDKQIDSDDVRALRCDGEDAWVLVHVASCTRAAVDALAPDEQCGASPIERLETIVRRSAKADVMELLQSHGIMATAVQDPREALFDPQLLHSRFFRLVKHPVIGVHPLSGPIAHMASTQQINMSPAPTLGQHNAEVLHELCSLSEAEIDALSADGLIGDSPDPRPVVEPVKLHAWIETGAVRDVDHAFRTRIQDAFRGVAT